MIRFVAVLVALAFLAGFSDAEAKRVALVVGNSAYEHVSPLANPRNDAEAIAAALERLEFEVIKGIDLNRTQFVDTVRDFARALKGADIALLFYAGHGLQVNGRNYLAPVETQLLDETDLEFETIRLETIVTQMEREPRTNLIFLDACRNNPMARNLAMSMGTRSAAIGRGLAPIETGIGTLIAFATQPGNVALDGEGKNSPFTEALTKYIETPGEDIGVLMRRVRQEVIAKTNGQQVPWDNSSLTGSVVLKAKPANDRDLPSSAESGAEIAYWNSIKDGTDERFFEAYLEQFPEGVFANLARLRISTLKAGPSTENQALPEPDLGFDPTKQQVLASIPGTNAGESLQPTEQDGISEPNAAELARGMQIELNRLGCDAGSPDGVWGRKSEEALRRFSEYHQKTVASLDPSASMLNDLSEIKQPVCPDEMAKFAGTWEFTKVAANPGSCGWTKNSRRFTIDDGKIAAPGNNPSQSAYSGTVTKSGSIRIVQTFVHDGEKRRNNYTGQMTDTTGNGTFQSQGSCRGTFTLSKLW